MKNLKIIIPIIVFTLIIESCSEKGAIIFNKESIDSSYLTLRKIKNSNYSESNSISFDNILLEKIDVYDNDLFYSEINNYIDLDNIEVFSSIIYFNSNEIIGYELFFIENNNLNHAFYKKVNNSYELIFNLKDNKIKHINVEFVFNYYLSNYENISIKLFINYSFNYDIYFNQRSEFDIYKQHIIFDNTTINRNNNQQNLRILAGGLCWGNCISEMDTGDCDFIHGCQGVCYRTLIEDEIKNKNYFNKVTIQNNFTNNETLHYEFRDFLNESIIGKKYIGYYSSFSSFIDVKNFSFEDFSQIVNLIPSIDNSISKLLDNNSNPSAILIDNTLKNSLITLLNNLKSKSNNNSYTAIINDVITDVNYFSGKSKNQILNEIQ